MIFLPIENGRNLNIPNVLSFYWCQIQPGCGSIHPAKKIRSILQDAEEKKNFLCAYSFFFLSFFFTNFICLLIYIDFFFFSSFSLKFSFPSVKFRGRIKRSVEVLLGATKSHMFNCVEYSVQYVVCYLEKRWALSR